ncbi:hypothetical protein KEM56_007892 [Ascosphaera pollenicola]|nr:hypothetical protein KEM56_007892 [Ascosphaera pollenicola]
MSPIKLRYEERAKRKAGDPDGETEDADADDDDDSELMDESDPEIRALLRRTKRRKKSTGPSVNGRAAAAAAAPIASPAVNRARTNELDKALSPLRNHTTSFSHSFSASTRKLRNGEVVVTNSDPESDDDDGVSNGTAEDDDDHNDNDDKEEEEEDSDDSDLENPNGIFSRLRSSTRENDTTTKTETASTTKKVTFSKEQPDFLFTESLDQLLRDSERDNEIVEKVAKASASISRYTLDKDNNYIINHDTGSLSDHHALASGANGTSSSEKRRMSGAYHKRRLTEEIVSAVIDEEDEEAAWKAERLSRAIDRTEVFDQGKMWLFFDVNVNEQSPATAPPPAFPDVQDEALRACLEDQASRNRAMLSGFLGDCLAKPSGSLPDQILPWLLESVTSEPRDLLRETYCIMLKRTNVKRISETITSSTIDNLFRRLGAKPIALDVSKTLTCEDTVPDEYQNRECKHLLSVLYVLDIISDRLNDKTRVHALKLVCRLAADETIMKINLRDVSSWLFTTMPYPEFQSQLLRCIPALDRRASRFRCRLACVFLYNDPEYLDKPFDHLFDIPTIINLLTRDKRFDVTRHKQQQQQQQLEKPPSSYSSLTSSATNNGPTDYYTLAALANLLSISIDNARSTSAPFATREEEDRFNEMIDKLVAAIDRVHSSIQDGGASHFKRMEAKEKLQMVSYRIRYGVRTRGVKKKSVFMPAGKSRVAMKEEEERGSRGLMASFLGKKG